MFLIGSGAMAKSGLSWRAPLDLDYLATEAEFEEFLDQNKEKVARVKDKRRGKIVFMDKGNPVEFELVGLFESANLLYERLKEAKASRITPEIYLSMKMSHRFLKESPHFLKTMKDIIKLKEMGVKELNWMLPWRKIREKETYDYGHPKLNQSKMAFFKDDFYIYDHDTLHLAVKLNDKPAYEYFKPDKNEVKVERALFDAAPLEIKLASVYEEACVLALERHQIPNDFKPHPRTSFLIAMEKVCTSITSGWWREFAYTNYFSVLDMYEKLGSTKYRGDFFAAKRHGKLKLHKE